MTLASAHSMSASRIFANLHKDLGLRKKSAQIVRRVKTSAMFVKRSLDKGKSFLEKIIMMDGLVGYVHAHPAD